MKALACIAHMDIQYGKLHKMLHVEDISKIAF